MEKKTSILWLFRSKESHLILISFAFKQTKLSRFFLSLSLFCLRRGCDLVFIFVPVSACVGVCEPFRRFDYFAFVSFLSSLRFATGPLSRHAVRHRRSTRRTRSASIHSLVRHASPYSLHFYSPLQPSLTR